MSFPTIIKGLYKILFKYRINKREHSYIIKIMHKNNLINKKIKGEDEYIQKWAKMSDKVDPIYYRCFSNYVGCNPNIFPGNLSVLYVEPILNPICSRYYYEDKNIYGRQFVKEWMPKTYLRRQNGIFMDEDYNNVNVTEENIGAYIQGVGKFVVKPSVDSSSGKNVSVFTKIGKCYLNQSSENFSYKYLIEKYKENFIIQEFVDQLDYLSQFNYSSVNTLRLIVYRSVKDNELHITNAILRIGFSNSVVDNAHAGGVFCGIDINGNLNKYVGNCEGETFDTFNGVDFRNNSFTIPYYNKIKIFAVRIAKHIPHHRLIALDLSIDKYGNPILIEYNIGGFGYWVFQLCGQVTLDGFSDEIIDYCSKRDKFTITSIDIQ